MTPVPHGSPDEQRPVIRDRRLIDPETYQVRRPQDAADGAVQQGEDVSDTNEFGLDGDAAQPLVGEAEAAAPQVGYPIYAAKISELEELADERTADLQRLQAEYANYKKRVDRDRGLARAAGVEAVVLDLLPVIDSIEAAREHDELTGGFKLVADELEKVGAKYGLVTFGEIGEPFDPQIHEALMHMPYAEPHDTIVVAAIMQKGVKLNDRMIRPARVGVADVD